MNVPWRVAISLAAAAALATSVATNALASHPMLHPHASGNVTVTGIFHAKKNASIYGHFYAHNKLEVWNGATVKNGGLAVSGGIKTDVLTATGGISADSASITSGLTAGTLTATGAVTGASVTTAGLTDSGSAGVVGTLTAGSVSTGALTATGAVLGSAGLSVSGAATFTGAVDLTHATLTGLPTVSISSLPTLSVGASTANTSPLTLSENAKTATLGVDSSGNLVTPNLKTAGDVAVGSNLTVAGTGTITGPFTANGGATLGSGSDLTLTKPSATAYSHVVANGDTDVAGTTSVTVPATTTGGTAVTGPEIDFAKAYTSDPNIILTPTAEPAPWALGVPPEVWVTLVGPAGNRVGFHVHYESSVTSPGTAYTATFNYVIIGS